MHFVAGKREVSNIEFKKAKTEKIESKVQSKMKMGEFEVTQRK